MYPADFQREVIGFRQGFGVDTAVPHGRAQGIAVVNHVRYIHAPLVGMVG